MTTEHQQWTQRYAARIKTAEEAVRLIAPGRRVLIGSGAAEPVSLVKAMVERGDHLNDIEVVHLMTLGPAPYVNPECAGRFRHTAFFIGANVRAAVRDGRADFMPVFLSEIPELIRSRRVRVDVALVQVSPPDAHGYVSLGVSVDVVRAAVESAELVLAEVNPRMPRTHGDSFVHISRLHALVPTDAPLLEAVPEPLDPVSKEIGRHVAALVPDGATLQLGIGKIPNATLTQLTQRNDLGVHTEMFSDGVMHLVEAGVITGRRKTLLPGKIVTSFVMGSRKLYDWVHDNPAVEMRPTEFTNDPFNIARNERMVSVNAALAVDLTGQVASDTLEGCFFSGIGGQVDFVRGANRSREGKSIIALPSTAKSGTISRIQACFGPATGVVTSRGDVRYVATEYGVADLWGRSVRERAEALINIAHPDFRSELLAAARERRYVYVEKPKARATYPWSESHREKLKDGTEIVLRPAVAPDAPVLSGLLRRFPDEVALDRLLHAEQPGAVTKMADPDYEGSFVLIAATPAGEILGLARYDVQAATRLAEVAFCVHPSFQGKGIGTELMRRLSAIAKAKGLAGFEADVRADNRLMLSLLHESGLALVTKRTGDQLHIEAHFDQPPTDAPKK